MAGSRFRPLGLGTSTCKRTSGIFTRPRGQQKLTHATPLVGYNTAQMGKCNERDPGRTGVSKDGGSLHREGGPRGEGFPRRGSPAEEGPQGERVPKGDFSCTFTYSAQGGTNEQWQMNVGVSEDSGLFSCSVRRPQGKSYLFFTQFKAEVKGAKIEYAMAYSQAAAGALSDIPLKQEEFEISETAVSHREGKFRFELSKLVIAAKSARDEL
ncbi:PREDICTED: myeloid-derived growth factor [Ficedula albicollis]|uniref:myeloid-derived growth factor n=1 Tax=Ficedula albicollis TaxID=59894 RepID=UPI00035A0957|nr:PREDICTED: myeloid-derived growth factor [Ficedula albicollis]